MLGREEAAKGIKELLCFDEADDARLVTITGPGGVGKTRLALQCGWELLTQFVDGIHLVELATVQSPDLLVGTIAQSLQIRDIGEHTALELLKIKLRERKTLLILDNFEHLLDAASLITELLTACVALKILVTSRARLALYGEHEFVLSPLLVPSHRDQSLNTTALLHYPSVKLFCARARAATKRFALTAENVLALSGICTDLDGLPLAIELAAAQMKYMGPLELAEQLRSHHYQTPRFLQAAVRDTPKRHRSVWTMIDWSYSLLSENEQMLFRRLAIFVGGFTVEAVARICQPDITAELLAQSLRALVDKSLVQFQPQSDQPHRYGLLEMMRQFGMEQLLSHDERKGIEHRHAHYYKGFLVALQPNAEDYSNPLIVKHIRAEYPNLRAMYAFFHREQDVDATIHCCQLLHSFWNIEYARDALFYFAATLALAEQTAPSAAYVELLAGMGYFTMLFHGRLAGRPYFERALAMNEQTGNTANPKRIGMVYGMLAWISFHHDADYKGADELFQAAQQNDIATGDDWALAMTLVNRGAMAIRLGQIAKAEELFDKALVIHQRVGDPWGIAQTLITYGSLHILRHEYVTASTLLAAAEKHTASIGATNQFARIHYHRAQIAIARGDLTQAQELLKIMLALQGDSTMAQYMLESIDLYVLLAVHMNQPIQALVLAAAIATNRRMRQIILPPQDLPWLQEAIQQARRQLSKRTADSAWTKGETFTLEDAVSYAQALSES